MKQLLNKDYELASIDAMRPHPRNPRRGDLAAVRESIDVNGFFGALVVQRSTGHILAGNHRWRAARELGHEQIPVVWVDVDDATALRILLADNRTSDLGSYDDEALAGLLQAVSGDTGSLLGTGYDDEALDGLLASLVPPDGEDWEAAFDGLPEGDRAPYQQMTFTLHDEQAAVVKAALEAAKARGCASDLNENSNGNALYALALRYGDG